MALLGHYLDCGVGLIDSGGIMLVMGLVGTPPTGMWGYWTPPTAQPMSEITYKAKLLVALWTNPR